MFKRIIALIVLSCSLQSCFFVVGAAIGGVAVGAVVFDKRTAKATEEDKTIVQQITAKLDAVPEIKSQSNIVVASFNQVVLLAGQTPNQSIKDEAEAIAQTVPNISKLYNEITISGASSSLTKASNTWITTKAKTQLAADKTLESGEIQVITVNGTVYLMGIVSKSQADTAVSIVQNISGVQKVVKIFSYDESDIPK